MESCCTCALCVSNNTASWLATASDGEGINSSRCRSEEFANADQTTPCILEALNVARLADSGVLGKLLIDDSVAERKLSPMHNSWGYLFALKVADRKVSDCLLTINFQITYKWNIKNRRGRPVMGLGPLSRLRRSKSKDQTFTFTWVTAEVLYG